MHGADDERSLFTGGSSYDSILTRSYTKVNAQAFYSKNIGFQFVPSFKKILQVLIGGMASYYNFYFGDSNIVFRLYNFVTSFLRYTAKPSLRAEKYLKASANSTTEYCKVMFNQPFSRMSLKLFFCLQGFWFLAEYDLFHKMPSLIAKQLKVNKVFKISTEPLQVYSQSLKSLVDVAIPSSHIGVSSIQCRLMSAEKRKGMVNYLINQINGYCSLIIKNKLHLKR